MNTTFEPSIACAPVRPPAIRSIAAARRRCDESLIEGQSNYFHDDELTMRVGLPHTGGSLALHAYKNFYPAMVSANAFWNSRRREFVFPEHTPLSDLDWALDSAGFTAMATWAKKGPQGGMAGGIFPWSYSQYLTLANISGARWYSQPDCCLEPEICASEEEIDYRIRVTGTLLEGCLRILYAWQNELVKEVSAETAMHMVRPPVPVLQGWSVDHYRRSLEMLQGVWARWQPWLAPPALIGIGSVCRRDLNHPTHGLWAVLDGLEGNLPAGSKVHCFGVKGSSLDRLKTMPWVASADSMAWDFGARVKARNAQRSNTMTHRCSEMTQWMQAAAARLAPAFNDRHPLPLAA